MLYSKNGGYPSQLPHRLEMPDGTTRTDVTTFTEEEIALAGYVAVENPTVPTYPQKLEWTGTEWLIREPSDAEIAQRWAYIQEECVRRLEDTDYKVIKAMEQGTPVEAFYVTYRQELRDLYNNANNVDPWFVEFPVLQTADEEYLES